MRKVKMLKVVPYGSNAKMGPGVGTTYRPVGLTCSPTCPLLESVCYAKRGHVNIHQARSADDIGDLSQLAGNRLVRHLVSGDWLRPARNGARKLDRDLVDGVAELHRACPWLIGWGYTHSPEEFAGAGVRPGDFPGNMHLLASCDTVEQKTQHNANGWRTARVIDTVAEKLPDEFVCPVDLQKSKNVPAAKRTNCARCQACFATTKNIAFIKF